MPQRKHLHCHPTDHRPNNHWAIEFDSAGQWKSPLMGWTSATADTYSGVTVRLARLQDAVAYCEAMGWGYDIMYPTNARNHVKKNYADNFMWKGPPKEKEEYD